MIKRIITILLVVVCCTSILAGCNSYDPDTVLLKDVFEDYFTVGVATGYTTMYSYTGNSANLISHFNSMTCENEMKGAALQPTEGNFFWDRADEQIDFAVANDMKVRGHALVWYQSAPSWMFEGADGGVATKEEVLERIRTHVDTVVTHFGEKYGNTVYCWDVVNEAISDVASEWYRTSSLYPLYEITGTEFISEAFIQARESLDALGLTDVKLFYNDYSMTDSGKRAKVIAMLSDMLDAGVPIDGMGMQCHYNIWSFDVDQFSLAIEEFAELGLEVHITELDLDVYQSSSSTVYTVLPDVVEELQATVYSQIFEVCRNKSDVVTNVTMWAVADDYTWLTDSSVLSYSRQNYPMLFDIFHEKKAAFYAIIDF